MSSRRARWTALRVRDRGRFCDLWCVAKELMSRLLTSLGDDGALGGDDDGPLELGFQVLNHLIADLLVELKGSEGDLDKDVFALGVVGLLVLVPLHGAQEHELSVLLHIGVGLLKSNEALGGLLFEFSHLSLPGQRRSYLRPCLSFGSCFC